MEIEVGKVYDVEHQRKGKFRARITDISGEFCTGEIVDGRAIAMLPCNARETGEEVDMRISFCKFTPVAE